MGVIHLILYNVIKLYPICIANNIWHQFVNIFVLSTSINCSVCVVNFNCLVVLYHVIYVIFLSACFYLVFALLVFVFCYHRQQLDGHAQEVEWRLEKTFIRWVNFVKLPDSLVYLTAWVKSMWPDVAKYHLYHSTSFPITSVFYIRSHLFIITWPLIRSDRRRGRRGDQQSARSSAQLPQGI